MSNQDYIARTPAKKKKNNPYKKNTTPPPPITTFKAKLIGSIVIVLIATFAYSLWFLKTSQKTKTPNEETITTISNAKEAHLPKPPKEKWTYVENLKTKEIEVGQYEVTQKGPYKLQCGSFKTTGRAETLKATIAFVGLEAFIKKSVGNNGTWYKVILGPYARKRLAEQDKHKLKNNNVNRCQVLLWK